MNKGVWFGFSIMALVVLATFLLLPSTAQMTSGHLGLLMLSLIVVATSFKSNAPASSAMRAWKTTWSSRSPSSSFRSAMSSRAIASATS